MILLLLEIVAAQPVAPNATPPVVSAPASAPVTTNEQDEDYEAVRVQGHDWPSQRGLGDTRIKRALIDASPRQQTSEMLSAAPGFFVDHEDGEGLGNDVYLRGFDLQHGSGIEMRIGSAPINIPTHIRGQGYADVNFIIPEVVRSIRVLQGPYDPRQGDAAIVGSAYFDVGVEERKYQLKATLGSFRQSRVVGIVAPKGAEPETFAAFSLRHSNGFGTHRESLSGSAMAQYGIDLGRRDHLRVLMTAYSATASLAGVVRQDDVEAGRIGFYSRYPFFAEGQGIHTSRMMVTADLDHVLESGARFELAPWVALTGFRSRQNFAGALETSQIDPSRSGLGDLFEARNRETAAGVTSRYRPLPLKLGPADIITEPGVTVRVGRTNQQKNLLLQDTRAPWDRRIDAGASTLDAGAYLDIDVRLFRRLRLSGGPRADLLVQSVDDRISGRHRDAMGVAAGPRATLECEVAPWLSPAISYGEGFRSLNPEGFRDGATRPFSKVRSVEGGVRTKLAGDRYTATVALFSTYVENELVFEAASGGLGTQRASTRNGFVGSIIAKPVPWLLASTALSFTHARYDTRVINVSHFVPNIPPILWRSDVTARGRLFDFGAHPVIGRIGVGYTFLSGRHLTDTLVGPTTNVMNASAGVRWDSVELGIDGYNVLGLKYADDSSYYASNWSQRPGQQLASQTTHFTAAPPTTLLGTLTLYL